MAKHISSVNFETYRGIRDLKIDRLGDINILLGDNNCGKTSFLEAIQILSRPTDFGSIVMIARQRDRFKVMTPLTFTQSPYTAFLNMFDRKQSGLRIKLECIYDGWVTACTLEGHKEKCLLAAEDLDTMSGSRRKEVTVDSEVETFVGILNGREPPAPWVEDIAVTLNRYSRVSRRNYLPEVYPVKFLSTVDHVVLDHFRIITRSRELTKQVVALLQASFDREIIDLRLVEEDDGRTNQMIEHRTLGYMPLSTYGDGIKKIIAMAGAAASIKGGVLLIDEFETAIHPKAMTQVFTFLRDVCSERNLQLFATTHSAEAVGKILECQKNDQDVRVITLYKNDDKTTARNLDAQKALEARDELGLELR